MALGTMYINDVGRGEARFLAGVVDVFAADSPALGELIFNGGFVFEEATGAICLPIIRGRGRGLLPVNPIPPP